MKVLGVSGFYHDSAAALLHDGRIAAAVQEERFSRRRHDAEFPRQAVAWCLDSTGTRVSDLDCVVFYDKPLLKFERLLETYAQHAPRGAISFVAAMRVWLRDKLFTKRIITRHLSEIGSIGLREVPPVLFSEHHQAHAASAFYPSPFRRSAILCLDGVGEWATTSAWLGEGNGLKPLWEIRFPHSIGLLYSAFTHYLGFRVNSGEYKVMGLAPYGDPIFKETILKHFIDVKRDGSFQLNTVNFGYLTSLTMTNGRFHDLLGGLPRAAGEALTKRHADLARSVQEVVEDVVLRLCRTVHAETGEKALCLAGGVALNCVSNTRLRQEGPFEKIWVQPAAGDAGCAIGAAYLGGYQKSGLARQPRDDRDAMFSALLGPRFSGADVRMRLDALGARYEKKHDEDLISRVASLLAQGSLIGWFQGRMEFGPRALGARSILADPRSFDVREKVNRIVKGREPFRPFAASVTLERASEIFGIDGASPYMLFVGAQSGRSRRLWEILDWEEPTMRAPACPLPAVIHADGSTRVQTVTESDNPRYYSLLRAFETISGVPVLLNTSFNVRGEPIVCTPDDAYACFMRVALDFLVIEDVILDKIEQPPWQGDTRLFEPD